MKEQNKVILFTGPSGVGKATIEKELFRKRKFQLSFSISTTTRKPRANEKNGVHYYFISHNEFNKMIENNEFLEWNEHFSNKYGTQIKEIKRLKKDNKIPFIEVEINGANNLIKKFGKENILSFFIVPPSLEELKRRINERNSETKKEVEERIERVTKELEEQNKFDYIIVNDNIKRAVKEIEKILGKELYGEEK